MKISRLTAAAAVITMTMAMFTACGNDETQDRSGMNGSENNSSVTTDMNIGSSGVSDVEETGDIDGDGFIEDVTTEPGNIVEDVVSGAENVVDDMIPGDNGNIMSN